MIRQVALLLLLVGVFGTVHAQQPEHSDTLRRELPKLEIPEITIIGKKAITLPFARKGEIYDVNIYDAAPPDTGLLMDRPPAPLPVGLLPRYQQREMPWRASLDGSFGSFATGNLNAFVDYKSQRWGIGGHGGFGTTRGHVGNADGRAVRLGLNYHSLVRSDNEILRSFRVKFGADYLHDSYGMYGLLDTVTDRKRNHFDLQGQIATLQRKGLVLDARLGIKLWEITDSRLSGDSSVTIASPVLSTSFATDLGDVRLESDLTYAGSSLEYHRVVESPSMLTVSTGVRWTLQEKFFLKVGARYANGSDLQGSSRTLLSPTGNIKWELSPGKMLTLWFGPEMLFQTYDACITANPYLRKDIDLRPKRSPINLGGSLWYNSGILTMELRASLAKSSNYPITLVDSGKIRLEYVDALSTKLEGEGSVRLTENTRIQFTGTIQPSIEEGSTTQLPMTPLVKLVGRGELELATPFTVWSTLEYLSKRNIDRSGTQTLGDLVLVGGGITSTIIPQALISLEISNLLNSAYEWWGGYVAPGRRITLEAKLGLQ